MTYLFLNTATGDYPRHPGDVELDPTAPWAEVVETPAPEVGLRQIAQESLPELREGTYYQTWTVVTFTESEWEQRRLEQTAARLASLGISLDDLRALLA